MEPSPEEQAMRIPEIIRTVCKFLPFWDLQNARLVCKEWNKEANWWFPKRAIVNLSYFYPMPCIQQTIGDSGLFEAFIRKEKKLQHQDLVATVPCAVLVADDEVDQNLLLKWIRNKDSKLWRIQILHLSNWSPANVKRCLPYILHNLSWLQEIGLTAGDSAPLLGPIEDFSIPADSTFLSLKKLCIDQIMGTDGPIDLSFVHRCKNLKTLHIHQMSLTDLRSFKDEWAKFSPTFRFDHVQIDMSKLSFHNNNVLTSIYTVVLGDLLQMILPKELSFTIDHNYKAHILHEVTKHVSSVTRMTLLLKHFSLGEMMAFKEDFAGFQGFSRLRELCIRIRVKDDEWILLKRYPQYPDILFNSKIKGFFKNLDELKGLTKLEVTVISDHERFTKETVLIALFHGYKPHVPLDLKIKSTRPVTLQFEYQFSAQQLERALEEAAIGRAGPINAM